MPKKHQKIGFDVFEYGIVKRRITEGIDESHGDWAVGHPVMFPQILFVGSAVRCSMQFRTPVDDENTLHVTWFFYRAAPGQNVEKQKSIPYFDVPLVDKDGQLIEDLVNHQDFVAWVTQGGIAPRHREHLGESDRGIILYRKLLSEQMEIVQDGGDPMGTVRDENENECIRLPLEHWPSMNNPERMARFVPSQAGQTDQHVKAIEAFLRPWAEVPPWEETVAK